jgi:hypothetical protein
MVEYCGGHGKGYRGADRARGGMMTAGAADYQQWWSSVIESLAEE